MTTNEIIEQIKKDLKNNIIKVVSADGYRYYTDTQTESVIVPLTTIEDKVCLEAVKQNGWALKYVKEQTPEICMAAVEQNGNALQYVKEQTPELCLEAVKRCGWALQYVKTQTPEICMVAVKNNKKAGYFVKSFNDEILRYLIENNIKFDLRRIKKNIPEDLKLLLILNYGVSPDRFK